MLETGTLLNSELDGVRDDNEYEMEDECRIYEVTTKGTLQPDGTMTADVEAEIYGVAFDGNPGICSITPIIARRDRFDEFAKGLVYSVQYRLTVPFTVTGVRITHLCTITNTRDAEFTNRIFEVRDVHRTTDISQRRITLHDLAR